MPFRVKVSKESKASRALAWERRKVDQVVEVRSSGAIPASVRICQTVDAATFAACHERAIREPFAHVCVSAAVAEELRQGWGAEVIANGVDARRFALAAEDVSGLRRWRARLGRYVLAVGGIEPRKGTLDLLEAYVLLRQSTMDIRLVIAGGETLFDYCDYRARFDARAAELGVEPEVLGQVQHDELPSLVAAASVFAFPSIKEGFGLAAMEALAAGVPVVTRDLPVLREVFGSAARFATNPAGLAARMRAALDDPGSFRAAGRALAAGYGWEKAAASHVRLYRRLLG